LDHLNLLASETAPCSKFFIDTLGFKQNEVIAEDGTEREVGSWLAVTSQTHDIAYATDGSRGARGRLHHIAFWQDTWDEVMRTAEIMRDAGIPIEVGPARHGVSECFFMYAQEPGGHRVEIMTGGYFQPAPDWQPIVWHLSEFRNAGSWWGEALPESFFTYGTPPIAEPVAH
jgi:catechol 2,3-dioxygenase